MRNIFSYIGDYYQALDKRIFLATVLFTALLIYLNYQHALEKRLCFQQKTFAADFFGHYLIFFIAFSMPYFLCLLLKNVNYFSITKFSLLLVLAPALFALKMALNIRLNITTDDQWNVYWNKVIYWPVLLLILTILLFIVWKIFNNTPAFYGLTIKNFNWKPYFMMLLIMIPLITAASTQSDFLSVYPRMNSITHVANNSSHPGWYKLLYQLSYGSDFFSIELFFRGFLILAFISIAGKDAILPMACFYCTIHFGKPLGECISSFFGGLLLGIIVYNTRSIFGGLMVHLGIAWLMEAGGYIGGLLSLPRRVT